MFSLPPDIPIPREIVAKFQLLSKHRHTEILSTESALSVLRDKSTQWRLFPSGHIIVALEPFKVMEDNFETIVNNCVAIYGSYEKGTKNVSSISFGSAFETAAGLIYRLDFYGLDDSDVMTHFLRHRDRALERYTRGRFSINLYLAPTMDTEGILTLIKDIPGVTFYISGVESRKLYLVNVSHELWSKI